MNTTGLWVGRRVDPDTLGTWPVPARGIEAGGRPTIAPGQRLGLAGAADAKVSGRLRLNFDGPWNKVKAGAFSGLVNSGAA